MHDFRVGNIITLSHTDGVWELIYGLFYRLFRIASGGGPAGVSLHGGPMGARSVYHIYSLFDGSYLQSFQLLQQM